MDIQVGQKYLTYNGWIAEIVSVDPSLTRPIAALVYHESDRDNAEVAQFDLNGKEVGSTIIVGALWELHEEPRVIWVRDDSVDSNHGNILTTEPSCIADGTNQQRPPGQPRWRKYQEVK